MKVSARSVLTVGHSTRAAEEFLGLLSANNVEFLVDVRLFPGSRRHPQFGREALSGMQRGEGIGSEHLPGLGGRRKPRPGSLNGGWRNASFRGYADHMETEEFGEGFERLLELCERERVCLMCSEAVWWRCHRRMISDALMARGIPVEHVLGEGRRQPHRITPFAIVLREGAERRLLYPPEEPDREVSGRRA